jgi:hypothetical protein
VDPIAKIVQVHSQDGSISKLHEGDDISAEAPLPAFGIKVPEFFRR